jgi:hypothetical protein
MVRASIGLPILCSWPRAIAMILSNISLALFLRPVSEAEDLKGLTWMPLFWRPQRRFAQRMVPWQS